MENEDSLFCDMILKCYMQDVESKKLSIFKLLRSTYWCVKEKWAADEGPEVGSRVVCRLPSVIRLHSFLFRAKRSSIGFFTILVSYPRYNRSSMA